MERCALCGREVEEEELDEGYEVSMCSICSRELSHYGSE
jgi:DNA-directed RNA polymerase subunit RPC12/RpoP